MKRRTLSFLLALAVSLSGLTALAAEPDLTTDYVNTFTESSSKGQAADSLIETVTIPEGSSMAGWLDPSNLTYSLYFGYPVPCENPATLYLSTVYAAKAAATDITLSLPETAKQGANVTAQVNILNQIGTTAGVAQGASWYVTNEDRTEILTDSGITVTPGENGAAQIAVSETAATGTYAIVAVSNENSAMLKGQKLTVTAKPVSNTVTVGEHGSVTFGTQTYAAGTHTVPGLNAGEAVSVTVTPEEGYEIDSVTYNGVALPSDHTSVVVVKDAVLAVSFKETAKVPTINAPVAGEPIPGSAGSENQYTSRVFYFRTSGIAWEAPIYGMYLSDAKDGQRLALDAKGTISNGMFGIRIYGAAVEETDYFVQGYVKSGEEEITSGESVQYSMK